MTGFDIIVLAIVGIGAIGGFMRGFVQEVLSLASWIFALLAIHYLHTDLTEFIYQYFGSPSGAAVLAFVLLLLIPYASMKLIASWAGRRSRASLLGPIDRVLGFGFGVLKGVIVAILGFSVLVLGYDTVWGAAGRPEWITTARTYSFINASSEELVHIIKERRERIEDEGTAEEA